MGIFSEYLGYNPGHVDIYIRSLGTNYRQGVSENVILADFWTSWVQLGHIGKFQISISYHFIF